MTRYRANASTHDENDTSRTDLGTHATLAQAKAACQEHSAERIRWNKSYVPGIWSTSTQAHIFQIALVCFT